MIRALGALAGVLLLATVSVAAQAVPAAAQESKTEKHLSHEAEACLELLEAGKEPSDCLEAPSLVLPEANEFIYGGLAFLILLVIMRFFAYPAVKKGMEARTQRIRDNLDEAERTKAEAQTVLEDYRRQVADAKGEAGRIIEEARQTAEQMRRDLMARAEAEVEELRERTRQEVSAAQQRAVADLRAQVGELAMGAAEVVVQKSLDRETNLVLVDRFIEQVASRA